MTKLLLLILSSLLRSLIAEEVADALASCTEDDECSLELLQRGGIKKTLVSSYTDVAVDPSCSAAPECAKLKLAGNCCPNDAGISLGCCPGSATAVPSPAVASVPKDSKRLCQNNPACQELNLEGMCCPNPAGSSLGCCDSEIEKQDMLGAGPAPELAPPAAAPGPLMTFYLYRVDNDQRYKLNGVNMANLLGDVWYLHNEVVFNCPRKFNISRLTRFKVTARATREGQLTPEDVILEFGTASGSPSMLTPAAEKSTSEKSSVFVSLDTIKVRSKYLWRLLQSPCRGNVVRHEDGRFTVEIHKYSFEALEAYGRYLHEDHIFCRPEVAMELLELAEEYVDSTGLAEQCAQLVRRTVCQSSLATCVASCLFLRRAALAVELTKLRLCVENCCDVLQVLESIDCMDLQAQYIRSIVMNFAAGNATAVVKSERFNLLADALKSRLFIKLATMGLLKT